MVVGDAAGGGSGTAVAEKRKAEPTESVAADPDGPGSAKRGRVEEAEPKVEKTD